MSNAGDPLGQVLADPAVRAILDRFPGAVIVSVRPPTKPEPATPARD